MTTPHPIHARRRRAVLAGALALAGLGLAACGEDAADAEVATTVAAAPAAPTTTATPATTEAPPTTEAPVTTDAAPPTTEAPVTTAAAPAPTGPTVVEVTARDFGFDGLPSELAAGAHEFRFTNTGTELHELVIFRNLEGLGLEELHALGPQGVVEKVELVGIVFADPGQPSPHVIAADLAPGEYEVVCFIPTPTDGQPHFAHGMHAVITVA